MECFEAGGKQNALRHVSCAQAGIQIFQPVDLETEQEALKTTQILVKTIYTDEEAAVESNEDIQGLARDACSECINILKEPEKTQARAATKVLCAFMSTTRMSRF